MQEASPQAVVALINGLFGTDFPPDSQVFFPNKEQVTEDLRQIVSDMMLIIGGEVFHLEAQIDDDLNMALRMFRYGYREAISKAKIEEDGSLTITFPQARVLYFETTKKTPEKLTLHIVYPDRSQHDYVIPAFKVLDHDVKELEGMKAALLLPFYILKYRQQVKAARSVEERQALAPAMKDTMESVLGAVAELREAEILTAADELVILGEVRVLYSELYKPYEEFREAKMTLEERYENPYLKAIREGRAEGKVLGRVEGKAEGKVEVARNLLKAGVSQDLILHATGLTMADIENQSKTAFSASALTAN
jgi:hypothetical protein